MKHLNKLTFIVLIGLIIYLIQLTNKVNDLALNFNRAFSPVDAKYGEVMNPEELYKSIKNTNQAIDDIKNDVCINKSDISYLSEGLQRLNQNVLLFHIKPEKIECK